MDNDVVYIDAACNINYASFYIRGLREIYGVHNVRFTGKYFKQLKYDTDTHILAFVINNRKYVIDFADANDIYYDLFLEWTDVYGKVNYNTSRLPQNYSKKVVRVGANFGVACYGTNRYMSVVWCIWHYLKCYKRLNYPFKSFLSPYLWAYKHKQINTIPIQDYSKTIFFVSRFWKGQNDTNNYRINFIRACKRLEKEGLVNFIGGMVVDSCDNNCPDDVLLKNEIPYCEYIDNLNRSILVFNTPAYHKCHGWKLPEYLSYGKAIISTQFVNELPIPLEHERNIYFTEGDECSIYENLKKIICDEQLLNTLRKGSAAYWKQYACFSECVKLFITSNCK